MKSVLQKTKMEWMQFVLFPFKVYICLLPLVFIILEIERGTGYLSRLVFESDQINLMVAGYIACIIILAIGGIYAAVTMRNWKLMRSRLIYAVIGLFLLAFILPSLAPTR